MSNFVKELEQDVGNSSSQGNDQQGDSFGGNDSQSSGNFGGNNDQSNDSQQTGGLGDNEGQSCSNQQQSSPGGKSSGGFMSNMESTGKDAIVDQEVNSFMTKEGVPRGADGMVDNFVNQELNKYS